MKALELPYEDYLALNSGIEACGICGALPKSKRLDRDHDHRTGKPRGLLCHLCNRNLGSSVTLKWLEAAKSYLERADGPG